MNDDVRELLDKISRQLSGITQLLAISVVADKRQRDQIAILSRAGLDRHEIASILGTTPGTVSVELSVLKKSKKRGK